jgi:phosphonate transport system substrate-binding protein
VLVGKHGDHIGGEKKALESMQSGEADACSMLDLNWDLWTADGTIDPHRYRVLATTDRFDHCVFTVRGDLPEAMERPWLDTLYSMSYDNPDHREMMDMEGLKAWLPGRTTGFGALTEAVERQGFFSGESR